MTEYFSNKQIEKVQDIIKEFYRLNNTFNSNCRIENIKMYKDNENNLYVSYTGKYTGIDGQTIGDYYLKIDSNGNEEKLNYSMNLTDLKEYFETLKQVNL
jgi:hypothetical protein